MHPINKKPYPGGLYSPEFEKGSCGFGLIAQMDNKPSHWLVQTAIDALGRLTHRGAVAADGKSGDGCGLLMKIPDTFIRKVATEAGIKLDNQFAVGMIFLNTNTQLADKARAQLQEALQLEGLTVAGWRPVSTNPEACGPDALKTLPVIEQVLINIPTDMNNADAERHLYIARRRTENALCKDDNTFYVPSLSTHVIAYKGLVMPDNLPMFYSDLQDEGLASSLAVFHQRFSTNTWPEWRLAQPFRYLAHNGEINTIRGNRNWSIARSFKFKTPLIPDMSAVLPWVSMDASDSCSMDNMLEALLAGGMDIFRAMRLLIPPAWQNINNMDSNLRAFYEYSSMHMEPWDGPAGVVMTDGRYAACTLDRNGLRPARYVITRDRHITLASEIGVYDYKPEDVVSKGRLKPGQMLAVDLHTGNMIMPEDVDDHLKVRQPYRQWLKEHTQHLTTCMDTENAISQMMDDDQFQAWQKLFQVSFEERDQVLRVLAEAGQEATSSMGDDTPMAVLTRTLRSPYDYFRQQFAQVTNPPIDPIREQVVMSLETCLGQERNLFEETADHAARILINSPVLSHSKFQQLQAIQDPNYAAIQFDLGYALDGDLESALHELCDQAVEAIRSGKVIIILSDRNITQDQVPVHALLATGAIHHRLIAEGLRCDSNLIIETASARDPHHFACLLGYGASAIYPYMAYECLREMHDSTELRCKNLAKAMISYRKGINKGLYKIISKMGISTISSYRGAQLFESVGLNNEIVDFCFKGTTNRIQGSTFSDLELDQRALLKKAWDNNKGITQGGLLKFVHGEEAHAYNPDVVESLQIAVKSGQYSDYQVYAREINERASLAIRDLLCLRSDLTAIPIDEVEAADEIYKRFDSAAMSLGALSPEAHETLAEAMNSLGARSNSGEGGEDAARYGTIKRSKIKQIASGRFGVTPAYLASAEVLQIKIAQGAKPGEGGQLPGDKVNELIARLRHCKPGVSLISPPPHHDIYSIEDLAQLIFDLKQVNPEALVSVKLVAEAGVGTIAAGVAKAYADLITISGHDGGTAASPLTSVKYAGSPWELGLTETHQILRANDLRDKVRIQTDGGLKTGLDVIKAAILGAESFGFGTGPMVAMGCKYLRICHLNNCATGIATQDAVLRDKHFKGQVEMVMNYFRFIAQETREWMAYLGIHSLQELIGRTDLLEIIEGSTGKQNHLDLAPILSDAGIDKTKPQFCTKAKNEPFDKGELAEQMVADAIASIEAKTTAEFSYPVRNTERSIGARLSGEIAKRHGDHGMDHSPITLRMTGTAGQSFGVWNAGGLHMYLEGDANDYVGKGMAGGKLIIYPPKGSTFNSQETTIIGNTCLYGATNGLLYAAGTAGERFAVRNSGATAIVEGVGDHCCEYMTGGIIVVLGNAGINFGAGMTGGFAYILDEDNTFVDNYNHELIDIHRISTEQMEAHREHLLDLITDYTAETESAWGQHILDHFMEMIGRFWLVKPRAADLDKLLEDLHHCAS